MRQQCHEMRHSTRSLCSVNAVTCHRARAHATWQELAVFKRKWDFICCTLCLDNPPPSIIPSKVQAGYPYPERLHDSDFCSCSRSTRQLSQGQYHCWGNRLVDDLGGLGCCWKSVVCGDGNDRQAAKREALFYESTWQHYSMTGQGYLSSTLPQ